MLLIFSKNHSQSC